MLRTRPGCSHIVLHGSNRSHFSPLAEIPHHVTQRGNNRQAVMSLSIIINGHHRLAGHERHNNLIRKDMAYRTYAQGLNRYDGAIVLQYMVSSSVRPANKQ